MCISIRVFSIYGRHTRCTACPLVLTSVCPSFVLIVPVSRNTIHSIVFPARVHSLHPVYICVNDIHTLTSRRVSNPSLLDLFLRTRTITSSVLLDKGADRELVLDATQCQTVIEVTL